MPTDSGMLINVRRYNSGQKESHKIIEEVRESVRSWQKVAQTFGLKESEIKRMESAFEHEDLNQKL